MVFPWLSEYVKAISELPKASVSKQGSKATDVKMIFFTLAMRCPFSTQGALYLKGGSLFEIGCLFETGRLFLFCSKQNLNIY